MAQTYLQLVNRCLRRLNEVQLTSSNFSAAVGFQAQVQDAVNDALNDIYTAELTWPFLYTTTTQLLTVGVQQYALPATFTTIDWDSFFVEANPNLSTPVVGTKVAFLDFQEWQERYKPNDETAIVNSWTSSYAVPGYVFYYKDNTNFGVTPLPNQAYTIDYAYWFRPTDLVNATDTVVIPDRYARVIIDGAMYYSYMFRDNPDEAGIAEGKFTRGIGLMRTEMINKQDYMRSDQLVQGRSLNTIGPI